MLRTGQNKHAGPPVGVNKGLEIREKLRNVLDFVNDGAWGEQATQEAAGILASQGTLIGFLEVDVFLVWETGSGKSGLAGLAWSRDGNHRVFCSGFA
jgi:hypothetical protein